MYLDWDINAENLIIFNINRDGMVESQIQIPLQTLRKMLELNADIEEWNK